MSKMLILANIFILFSVVRSGFLTSLFGSSIPDFNSYLKLSDKFGTPLGELANLDPVLSGPWVVIGKPTCPYTQKALVLLRHEGYFPKFVDKATAPYYEKLKTELHHETIPLVVNEGMFIGGYTQVLEKFGKEDKEVEEWKKEEAKVVKDWGMNLF